MRAAVSKLKVNEPRRLCGDFSIAPQVILVEHVAWSSAHHASALDYINMIGLMFTTQLTYNNAFYHSQVSAFDIWQSTGQQID